MAHEVKVSLTVTLVGGQLIKTGYSEIDAKVKYKEGNKIKVVRKKVKVPNYVHTEATHHHNIYQEAFDYFTSDEAPSYYKGPKNGWKNMSKKARLEVHLKQIMLADKGFKYTYEILED